LQSRKAGKLDHQLKDHQPKDHQFKDHQLKDHQFKDHQLKDHQFKDHQLKDHQFKETVSRRILESSFLNMLLALEQLGASTAFKCEIYFCL
jgi:hypothetical protein